ncbi:unnamed protein product [marine sediment metagenome]|uniref:Uncharacterized protein n=1 Tax=marine sediment metagenome TaxID=412755 RepID=X0ZKV0_9ZZZZ
MNKKTIVFTIIALLIINTFGWIIKIANQVTYLQEIFLEEESSGFFESLSTGWKGSPGDVTLLITTNLMLTVIGAALLYAYKKKMNKETIVFTIIALLIINTFGWIIKIANKATYFQEMFLYGRPLEFFEGLSKYWKTSTGDVALLITIDIMLIVIGVALLYVYQKE